MATATERRFTSLRKRLDQLGYRQPLGVESLPLVEKLFGDLLHTTESLKSSKQQLGKQKEQKVRVYGVGYAREYCSFCFAGCMGAACGAVQE